MAVICTPWGECYGDGSTGTTDTCGGGIACTPPPAVTTPAATTPPDTIAPLIPPGYTAPAASTPPAAPAYSPPAYTPPAYTPPAYTPPPSFPPTFFPTAGVLTVTPPTPATGGTADTGGDTGTTGGTTGGTTATAKPPAITFLPDPAAPQLKPRKAPKKKGVNVQKWINAAARSSAMAQKFAGLADHASQVAQAWQARLSGLQARLEALPIQRRFFATALEARIRATVLRWRHAALAEQAHTDRATMWTARAQRQQGIVNENS